MHGASLLYNLLIAERYEKSDLSRVEEPVVSYRGRLASWAGDVQRHPRLPGWDRQQMWDHVIAQNARVAANGGMRHFVNRWLDAVCSGQAASAPDHPGLRDLVAMRERSVKRGQSRLVNEKLLRTWSGASGSSLLTYRWPQVKRLLIDVHDGLEED
jgi:hypothetical protein